MFAKITPDVISGVSSTSCLFVDLTLHWISNYYSSFDVFLSTQLMSTLLHIACFSTGIGTLYRGLAPTIVRSFPASGILFLVVEYTRKVVLCQKINWALNVQLLFDAFCWMFLHSDKSFCIWWGFGLNKATFKYNISFRIMYM